MCVHLFTKMDSLQMLVGTCSHSWCPLPFDHQGVFLHLCREVFLDLGIGPLVSLLQQRSASATSFVLGVSGWEQNCKFTPVDKTAAVQPRGLSISYLNGIIVSYKEESKSCLLLPGKMSVPRRQEKPSKVRTEVFGLWLLSRGLESCWEWSVCYKNVLDLNPKETSQFFSETKCPS